ncbi:MAG: hypothetical protein ABIN36_03900 [Ferruginibacter sp.]
MTNYNCRRLYIIPLIYLLILLAGCKKKHEAIYGNVTIDGSVTDAISGAPIQNVVVRMYNRKLVPNGFGGSGPVTDFDRFITDTADANGNYDFSLEATGQYEFEIIAVPYNEQYVSISTSKTGHIKSNGLHVVNLLSDRSAHARIIVTNTAPLDTTSLLYVSSSQGGTEYLRDFYRDTILYVKIQGGLDNEDVLRLYGTVSPPDKYVKVSANRWDTVNVNFDY